jgi:hypothetical protein
LLEHDEEDVLLDRCFLYRLGFSPRCLVNYFKKETFAGLGRWSVTTLPSSAELCLQ